MPEMNRLITAGKAVKDVIDRLTTEWGAAFRDPIKEHLKTVANHRMVAGNVVVALDAIPAKTVVEASRIQGDLVLGVSAGSITAEHLKAMVLTGQLVPSEAGALRVCELLGRNMSSYTTVVPETTGSLRFRILPGVAALPVPLQEELARAAGLATEVMATEVVRPARRAVAVRRR